MITVSWANSTSKMKIFGLKLTVLFKWISIFHCCFHIHINKHDCFHTPENDWYSWKIDHQYLWPSAVIQDFRHILLRLFEQGLECEIFHWRVHVTFTDRHSFSKLWILEHKTRWKFLNWISRWLISWHVD